MKKSKIKVILRKKIQDLYEIAELIDNKKQKKEIYYSINHINNILIKG